MTNTKLMSFIFIIVTVLAFIAASVCGGLEVPKELPQSALQVEQLSLVP